MPDVGCHDTYDNRNDVTNRRMTTFETGRKPATETFHDSDECCLFQRLTLWDTSVGSEFEARCLRIRERRWRGPVSLTVATVADRDLLMYKVVAET